MISLKECIAIALEQGNVGFQTPTALGSKLEILPSFNGTSVTGTDSIRAFAIDPATMANELERSLSKFDVQWINSLTWQKVDNPVAAQFLTFSSQYDTAALSSTLVKPLAHGRYRRHHLRHHLHQVRPAQHLDRQLRQPELRAAGAVHVRTAPVSGCSASMPTNCPHRTPAASCSTSSRPAASTPRASCSSASTSTSRRPTSRSASTT